VVAHEDTGFADPPKRLLAALSRDGAVVFEVTGVRATGDVQQVDDWYVVPLPWSVLEDG
jgi:hypothetical protein